MKFMHIPWQQVDVDCESQKPSSFGFESFKNINTGDTINMCTNSGNVVLKYSIKNTIIKTLEY